MGNLSVWFSQLYNLNTSTRLIIEAVIASILFYPILVGVQIFGWLIELTGLDKLGIGIALTLLGAIIEAPLAIFCYVILGAYGFMTGNSISDSDTFSFTFAVLAFHVYNIGLIVLVFEFVGILLKRKTRLY